MNNNIYFPGPIQPINNNPKANIKKTNVEKTTNFQDILNNQLGVKFSKHALEILERRNINLDSNAMEKLNAAVLKATNKGAKESLVLMDDLAFVVSIKNKTVITAVDGANIKENVFTNIDSAVII
jgi:flagellar operon protein